MNFGGYIWCQIGKMARQRGASIALVGLLSFTGSWLWAQRSGFPVPYVTNEFSYLLAADTFAHGRISNPVHPMWTHFETFFVLQHPSYMSMYAPAQGAFLALGKVIFGHPIFGVWLSCALMCASICWMLYAWVPARWALMGGVVAVMQFGIFTYWSQSYWGGAVAAMGGALVLGALPRIAQSPRLLDAIWLGLGCMTLAHSRPLEGFWVALPVGFLMLPWKIKGREFSLTQFTAKIIIPLVIILFLTLAGSSYYNKKITGDARILPQLLYFNTYSSVPVFNFQPLRPPVHFDFAMMGLREQESARKHYLEKRMWQGFCLRLRNESFRMLAFYFGFPLALPSLAILFLLYHNRQARLRLLLALLVIFGEWAVVTYDAKPHYYAPLTCLAVLLMTLGLRGLSWLNFCKIKVGPIFVMTLIIFQLGLDVILTPHRPVMSLARIIQGPLMGLPQAFSREALKDYLIKKGGKYLVIVHYSPQHNYLWEWVYNDADIDHAPIVWARDMGEVENAKLFSYFKDRQVININVCWDASVMRVPAFDERQ